MTNYESGKKREETAIEMIPENFHHTHNPIVFYTCRFFDLPRSISLLPSFVHSFFSSSYHHLFIYLFPQKNYSCVCASVQNQHNQRISPIMHDLYTVTNTRLFPH